MPWNPFNWTAEPFLILYTALAATVFLLGFGFRWVIGPPASAARQLSVLELAYLAGGERRFGDAVLLSLTSGNGATIDTKDYKITVTNQAPLAALCGRRTGLQFEPSITRLKFQKAVKPLADQVLGRLQQYGYCPTDEQMSAFRMSFLPFVALLLLFGITKAFIGAGRHHPVGLLIALLVVTAFVGFLLATRPVRTRAGKEVLAEYQASKARAARAPLEHELLLAVALSGTVVLSGTAYGSVHAASQTMSSSSGDGGGGCGGGGGGCGGCS